MAEILDVSKAEQAPYGIVSPAAAVHMYDTDERWGDIFEYETLDCSTSISLYAPCTTATAVVVDPSSGGTRYRSYIPFVVEAKFECSTFSFKNGEHRTMAEDRLDICLQKGIEAEFWTGEFAKVLQAERTANGNPEAFPNRYLASPDAVDVTPTPGTAIKPKYGLALLEKALADCGCGVRGTIHASRGLASALGVSGNNALVTNLGTKVIAGSGYTGSGPDGTVPTDTSEWMYATGPVTVHLGPVTVLPDNDGQTSVTKNNSIQITANRFAAVTWDSCCHFAVQVDMSLDYA